jgi:hypothetical protein
MKALAEFAMRSRWHAIGASMVAAIVPLLGWLSTVLVVLVCLRHGVTAGTIILMWTLLPIGGVFYFMGDPSSLITLLGTFAMAVLLRQTLSWELVLVASVVLAAIGTVLFEFAAAGVLDRFVTFYIDYLAQIDSSLVIAPQEAKVLLLGFFAMGQAFAMIVLLIIGRWCQSALYNEGGFKSEFHQLRLSPAVSAVIVLSLVLCYAFNDVLGRWLPLLTVPLIFASLGLVHWTMADRKLSNNWVTGFYASLVFLFQLVYPMLASIALMDSWFNIRNKIQTNQKD